MKFDPDGHANITQMGLDRVWGGVVEWGRIKRKEVKTC